MQPRDAVLQIASKEQFEELVRTRTFVVLNFGAKWCHPCRRFEPLYEGFPRNFPQVWFAKADVDEVEDLASDLNVSELPAFLLFRRGTQVGITSGLAHKRPARRLATAIQKDLLQMRIRESDESAWPES